MNSKEYIESKCKEFNGKYITGYSDFDPDVIMLVTRITVFDNYAVLFGKEITKGHYSSMSKCALSESDMKNIQILDKEHATIKVDYYLRCIRNRFLDIK